MFIRYPGSKDKLAGGIVRRFPDRVRLPLFGGGLSCYCEPFFGSGAIGWKVLVELPRTVAVLVNDLDAGVANLWRSVQTCPDELTELVLGFEPSADRFYEFKAADGDPTVEPVEAGFRKLALHQMSFSGLGVMAGGPLGGRAQTSDYDPACRWRPRKIARKIRACHKLMTRFARFEVMSGDFAAVLSRVKCPRAFVYLDPPYYVQGAALYRHAMTDADHARLAAALKVAPFDWVLSYDDAPQIRGLYDWAEVTSFEMTPTIDTAKAARRKNRELLISKPPKAVSS